MQLFIDFQWLIVILILINASYKFSVTLISYLYKKTFMESFKTIAVFNYDHETIILKHLLQQEGIPYFFENEMTLSVVPMYTTALGGIKLKVHPEDFEQVQQILDSLNNPLKIV